MAQDRRYAGAATRGFTQEQMQQPVQQAQQQHAPQVRQARGRVAQAGMNPSLRLPHAPFGAGAQQFYAAQAEQRQAQQAQRNAEYNQRRAMGQAERDAFTASELQRRENVRDELFGMGRQRVEEMRTNPLDEAIQAQLMSRVQGGGPFDDATRNALLSQQAEMADAALGAQMRQMGGRPGDPARQAQMRGAELSRAQSMQDAARNIDMQRAMTNYQAQGQALGQAAGINRARQSAITDADRFLQSLLAQEQFQAGMPSQEVSFADYARARNMMG